MVPQKARLSVAVVGSGLAGLTAAYLLASPRAREAGVEIEVHLFEKASILGMDSHSISIAAGDINERRIDVPMRSFQGGYYKQLIALYRSLGVKFRCADFSYSFSIMKDTLNLQTYFIYNGSSGSKGVSIPSNGQSPQDYINQFMLYLHFTLSTLMMLFNYLRIIILSAPFFRPDPLITFREWSSGTTPRGAFARWTRLDASWRDFTQKILLPMFSAVCTAPEDDVYAHPAYEFLEYIWLTLGTRHYVVQRGVRDVVSRLSRRITHIHLASNIVSIASDPSDASTVVIRTSTKTYTGFSHLILATQANQALSLLSSYCSSLPEHSSEHGQAIGNMVRCLETFQYRNTVVINHMDDTFLPSDERDRRDLNLVVQPHRPLVKKQNNDETNPLTVSNSYTMATHVLQNGSTGTPLYQTTNPITLPSRDLILSVSVLERAVVTVESKNALRGLSVQKKGLWPLGDSFSCLGHLQGAGRLQSSLKPGVWVCGSYAHAGIPLLEGCVASARNVVEQGVLRSEGVVVRDTPW